MRKNLGVKPYFYPMPVLVIGTYNEDGTANAMTAAWGGIANSDLVAICIDRGHKTLENLRLQGAFTVSIATESTLAQADYLGIDSGHKVPDKVAKTGLTVVKSEFVNAARWYPAAPASISAQVSAQYSMSRLRRSHSSASRCSGVLAASMRLATRLA